LKNLVFFLFFSITQSALFGREQKNNALPVFSGFCQHSKLKSIIFKNNETERFRVAAEPATSDEQKNVSDAELARRINSSRQTVNNWINGRRDINIRWLHKVADALEVRVRDLFNE